MGTIYYCDIKNNPLITSPQTVVIESLSGFHTTDHENFDVNGFRAYRKKIKLFPVGLENYFENLKAIAIYHSGLKEIHQRDLKPFSKLIFLNFYGNKIEFLEEGLFNSNLDLEFIGLGMNKIYYVNSKVFDNLRKLTHLKFAGNKCIDDYAENNATAVLKILDKIKDECGN